MATRRAESAWAKLRGIVDERPISVSIPAFMVPVGATALVLGEGASRAFTLIGGGQSVARLMGALLAGGGAVTLTGVMRGETLTEMFGHAMMSAGAAIYALGVILGLGTNGIIAGGGYAAIAVGCAGRVVLTVRHARRVRTISDRFGESS